MDVKPGFRQTDVGLLPTEWSVCRLGTLTTKVGSGITPTGGEKVYKDGGRPFLRSQNVGWGRLLLDDIAYIDDDTHSRFSDTEIKLNDVLLNITGASIGRTAVANERLVGGNVNQHVCVIRPDGDRLEAQYLHLFLLSEGGQKQIDSFQAGGNRQGLNFGQIRSFEIPLPPVSEQQAIAEALSDVDALISALDRLIAKKRAIKEGAMQELLTGRRRLPGFDGEWEMTRVGDMVDTDPENLGSDTRSDYAFNYITLEDVVVGALRSHSEQVFLSAPSRARRKLRARDVLVSTVRPTLMSHLLFLDDDEDWICSTGFCVVRCRDGVAHPGYVYYHLFSEVVGRQIDALLTGSNYPAINSGDVRALQIPFPEYAEQTAIATVLSDMDAEIVALERRRDKTKLLKQGMMQELLTGKTRLL